MNRYHFLRSKFAILLLLSIFVLSSCITNRDLEYIRTNKEIKIDDLEQVSQKQDYRLQVGDLLSVKISTVTEQSHDFFNKEQTSNSQLMSDNPYLFGYLIQHDGFLNLPSFGRVQAEGFTLSELESIIQQIAVSYFESPVVKLNIINFEVSVLGEVNKPGAFKIIHPNVNVLYALSLAGDMTQLGNRKRVKIIRNENGLNRLFYVDLTDVNNLNNVAFFLQPDDIIYVSPTNKRFYAFNNLPNVISMAISAITLYLLIKTD